MAGHKFHGDLSRLDNPKRAEVLPVDSMVEAIGKIFDGMAVADLGSGTGYLTIPLAKRIGSKGTVYAVDINPQMIEVLRERAKELDNVEIIKSEENSIPIPDATIDTSFLVTVFHELENPSEFLAEIRRISKPLHQIIVVDWNQVRGEMGPPMEERIPEEEVIQFFRSKGYAVKKKFSPSGYIYGVVFSVPACDPTNRCWA